MAQQRALSGMFGQVIFFSIMPTLPRFHHAIVYLAMCVVGPCCQVDVPPMDHGKAPRIFPVRILFRMATRAIVNARKASPWRVPRVSTIRLLVQKRYREHTDREDRQTYARTFSLSLCLFVSMSVILFLPLSLSLYLSVSLSLFFFFFFHCLYLSLSHAHTYTRIHTHTHTLHPITPYFLTFSISWCTGSYFVETMSCAIAVWLVQSNATRGRRSRQTKIAKENGV